MRTILFLVFSALGTTLGVSAYGADNEKFIVYYSDQVPVWRLNNYHLLVLDAIHHPPLRALAEDNKSLLGYISLGEIEKTSPYFKELKKEKIVLNENPNWKGSYTVDIRSPVWQRIVLEERIPALLREGFNGVFFDTLDSPLELERAEPGRYTGMKEATRELMQAIKMHYPSLRIMVNRGYAVLPQIAPYIDMVLGESTFSEYDFASKKYVRVTPFLYRQQVKWLRDVRTSNPDLKIYTLDYADTENKDEITEIYRQQRSFGFIPYVASVELDEVIEEPGETLRLSEANQ